MPFGEFTNLTDDDLKAMFAYLRSLPPVKHRVDNSLPPTYCKLCRQNMVGTRTIWQSLRSRTGHSRAECRMPRDSRRDTGASSCDPCPAIEGRRRVDKSGRRRSYNP
jgi:hypothetical protein